MIDLTAMETPTLEYAVRGPDGAPVEISLDLDRVTLDLSLSVPTLFQPTGELDEAGEPMLGLHKLMQHLKNGTPLPEAIPNWTMVEMAIRRAMQIPAHCGLKVVMRLMTAFLEAVAGRASEKKGSPVSPVSPTDTPA